MFFLAKSNQIFRYFLQETFLLSETGRFVAYKNLFHLRVDLYL